jgi:DNA polymerase III delta prime subunit
MEFSFFEKKPSILDIDFKIKYYNNLVNFDIETMPNLIFYGNKGSGKTLKIYAFLCSLLCEKVYNLKYNEIEIEKRIFKFKSSIYHLEIDALELLNNERLFFQNYLKEYCDSRNIGLNIPKIIIILNFDKINRTSLLMLRKLIESNYMKTKYIFETSNMSSIPESLITRFLTLRIKSPSREEIEKVLNSIIKKKRITIPKKILNSIIDFDKNYKIYYDLNNIFNAFNYYLSTKELLVDNYHKIIDEIINIIVNSKNKKNFETISDLKAICEKIFINCYDTCDLVNSINNILIQKFIKNESLVISILDLSCKANINLSKSTGKYFIHLENYFVKLIVFIHNS